MEQLLDMNYAFGGFYTNGLSNCTPPAIDDFPRDIFTPQQRTKGAVAFHISVSLYLFAALAVVCDKYFVPSVGKICEALNMSSDVAGATFMAAATSAPELFVNVIGTFITEGDIGIGTIVGSAVFNILAIAACCGLCAITVIPLHWWPLTRDCIAYGVTVTLLIFFIHDERIDWYEALVLVLCYGIYTSVMYWDKSLQRMICGDIKQDTVKPDNNHKSDDHKLDIYKKQEAPVQQNGDVKSSITTPSEMDEERTGSTPPPPPQIVDTDKAIVLGAFSFPVKPTCLNVCIWLILLPVYTLFLLTIPDCNLKQFKRWFPLTFIMCILWIGSLSYVVAWMITIVGDTLQIPDSVMGITFLAAGTSVPEAVSSVIVAKQGHGDMGISNSLGSNTFDVLLCLGLPWFIKASFLPSSIGHHYVAINSKGLEYVAISLLSTLLVMYAAFAINKFKLDKKVGYTCLIMYITFLVLATLMELNVFFVVNQPTCVSKRS